MRIRSSSIGAVPLEFFELFLHYSDDKSPVHTSVELWCECETQLKPRNSATPISKFQTMLAFANRSICYMRHPSCLVSLLHALSIYHAISPSLIAKRTEEMERATA